MQDQHQQNTSRTKKILRISLLLFMCLCLVTGCNEPQRKLDTQGELPAIPAPINQGPNTEPELYVYLHEADKTVSMPMEQYIMGVVAGEMDMDWPENALAAQAILARTFTLQKISENNLLENRNAHASTNEKEFQAYNAEKINARIQAAVEKTRGQVLIHNNEFIRAWFHAYSGGKTTTAEEGLDYTKNPTPYIQPVEDSSLDAYIPDEVRFWSASFPLSKIRSAVKQITGTDPGPITSIQVAQRSESNRAISFLVNNQEVKGNALRLALDSTLMKSTLIHEIVLKNGNVIFRGKGYGHGVGMSQWGARVMAEQGKNIEEIALYYYKDCQIIKLW